MKLNRVKAHVCILGLFILCQQAVAQTEQPAMELLEFLGSAEIIDGEWLDPLHMLDLQQGDLQGGQREERDDE